LVCRRRTRRVASPLKPWRIGRPGAHRCAVAGVRTPLADRLACELAPWVAVGSRAPGAASCDPATRGGDGTGADAGGGGHRLVWWLSPSIGSVGCSPPGEFGGPGAASSV